MRTSSICLAMVLLGSSTVLGKEPQPDATAAEVNALLATMADAPAKADRTEAAETLLRMGKAAVPALAAALKQENPTFRYHAAAVLGGIGPDAAAAVPELIRAAGVPKGEVGARQRAVYALGEIWSDAKRCLPFLVGLIRSAEPDLDELAGEVVGKFGAKAKAAVPALVKLVEERQGKLAVVVATLGRIGPEAEEAVPCLKALRSDPKYGAIRPHVERALEQIQPDRK